jgi:type IV secretion system protein TrbL
MGPMLAYANRLFGLLLAIELAVTGAKWVLEKDDTRSFIAAMVSKILGVGFFYALLQFAPTWIPALMNSFRDAGATVGGAGILSPSAVFAQGLNFVIIIFKSISDMDLWDAVGVILAALPAAVFIIMAFVVVAGQLLVTLVESYIVISAAVIFLGFGGSRWTQDFVQKYLGYAIAVGVKLMIIYLLIGASSTLFNGWAALLSSATSGLQFIINSWVVMGGAAFFAFLAWMIPSMASSMLSGSPSLTGGAAAGVIGGMVAGGVAAAATAGKGLGNLASAAGAAFKGGGAGGGAPGLAGAAAGGVSTLAGAAGAASGSSGSPGQVAPPSSSGGSSAAPQAAGKGAESPSGASSAKAGAVTSAASVGASMASSGSTPPAPAPAAESSSSTSSGAKASSSSPGASAAVSSAASRPVVDDFGSVVPPASSSDQSVSAAASSAPTEANGIGSASAPTVAPPGASEGQDKGPGLLDRLRKVRAPHLPSDAASGGTVHIRLDGGRD